MNDQPKLHDGDNADGQQVGDSRDSDGQLPANEQRAAAEVHAGEEAHVEEENSELKHSDYGMPVHPVADLFPLLSKKELENLTEDIRQNGLVNPTVINEGQIVEGRSRILACREAGVEPQFAEWRDIYKGSMSLPRWIWSMNAERRHMSQDQIAAVKVLMSAWEEGEAARQRKAEGQKRDGEIAGRGRTKSDSLPTNSSASNASAPTGEKVESGDVRARLANESGASEYKVQQALNVERVDPELLEDVAPPCTRPSKTPAAASRSAWTSSSGCAAMLAPSCSTPFKRACAT
jgi:hypothetical protein